MGPLGPGTGGPPAGAEAVAGVGAAVVVGAEVAAAVAAAGAGLVAGAEEEGVETAGGGAGCLM